MIIDIYLSKAGYEMKNYADRSVRPRWITDSEICAILRIILRPIYNIVLLIQKMRWSP